MAYNMKERLSSKQNYTPSNRTKADVKYIVIHYTGNDGDTDENNGNYFANNYVGASAHYFVDDDSVTISVLEKDIAWHCGANIYYHKHCRNSNSIGIEICDDQRNGTVYPSAKTIENAVALTKSLMQKYAIPLENVIRHYDVSHKICPAYWCGSSAKDKKWQSEFLSKLGDSSVAKSESKSTDKITVDGVWGKDTTTKAQQVFKTTVDGIVSNQDKRYKAKNKGLLSSTFEWKTNPLGGSLLIKAIQKKVGTTADGIIGDKTIKAMQKWLGTIQDGVVSKKSAMVKAFQVWLNEQ